MVPIEIETSTLGSSKRGSRRSSNPWLVRRSSSSSSRSSGGRSEEFPPAGDLRFAGLVVALTLVAAGLAWLEARRRAWGLREHDLIYRSGLFVRTTSVLPLARVQHVETVSGPLERAFGLVRLSCFTAGGLSSDLVVAGLDSATAERVRSHLLGRIRELDDAESESDA